MIIKTDARLLYRLTRISVAVHAAANSVMPSNRTARQLLDEAKCDCEECKKRRTESG